MPEFTFPPRTFASDTQHFLLDGQPLRLFSGEMHYFRVPREYWRDRFRKARAMGLNAICTYMPWNLHEPEPGMFDFTGMLDVATFLREAQEEGLLAILRPGPYICAEWDFGGLPPWLLRVPDIKVRCADTRFVEAAKNWIARVGQELSPLICAAGGPIVMVQVENEYGAFGNDKPYLEILRQATLDAGFVDLPLFTCDWATPHHLAAGGLAGCIAVANFGSRSAMHIDALRRLRPGQPAMCGEFWCGWFDAWGTPRNGGATVEQSAAELQALLDTGASFNLYMFHGGTNFGFTAGANAKQEYVPTVTSYDYHAPLDEAGRMTPKYFAFRDLLARHQPPGVVLPPVPLELPEPITIPAFEFPESAALLANLPPPVHCPQPRPMEAFGQSHGLILYRTNIAGLGAQELRIMDVHDYAVVFLNGAKIATLDRRRRECAVTIDALPEGDAVLDILVDTTGRVNFGHQLLDRKGITDRVEYGDLTLMDWQVFLLPLDATHLRSLQFTPEDAAGPAVHRGSFLLERPGDTFLHPGQWKRGAAWVNGHALGRFWNIGPQETLFVPGCWLRAGRNEVIVFDLETDGRRSLAGLDAPILG